MQIIDADGHVAETPSLAIEALKRWPDHVRASTDGKARLVIEGRNYPEDSGPGAGCPPEHGISKAPDINCRSVEGVLGDADQADVILLGVDPGFGRDLPPRARGAMQPEDRAPLRVAELGEAQLTVVADRDVALQLGASNSDNHDRSVT